MTYNGLETCILNSQSYETDSRASRDDGFPSSSLDEDNSSCSSSKDAFGLSFSKRLSSRTDEHGQNVDALEHAGSPRHFYVKEKPVCLVKSSDVEMMKEKFAKLLLGEDTTGGKNGLSTALALSNAISSLAGTHHGLFALPRNLHGYKAVFVQVRWV